MASYTSNTGNQWTLIVDVTNVQVDTPNNRSKVSWSVKLKDVNRAIQALCTYHLSINGTNVWASASGGTTVTDLTMNNTTTLASGTTGWISHNSNGSKSVSISAGIKSNISTASWSIPQLSISETLALTTIPRASSFTLSGATRTNADIKVSVSRKSTDFTHRVRWRVGSGSWTTVHSSVNYSITFKVQPSDMPNLKSATITIGVQTYNGDTAIGSEATATRTITIPNSTITLSGTANTGSTQTVTITNGGGSLTYTRSWKLGSATGTNSSTWTPPHSALPSSTSGTLTCTVVTKNGTATINTVSATRTITVPTSVLPTFGSITHAEYVTNVATLVGAYVQGKTRLTLGVTSPSAGSGSSIKSYSISVGGRSVSSNGGTTAVINQSGTLTITATVTDNRNRTVTKTDTITVLPYENPIVNGVSFTRSNADGTPNATGTHLTIKATIRVRRLVVGSTEKNKIRYQSQSAQMGGSYTTKTNLENESGSISGNYRQSVYTHTFSGYPIDYPYNIRVRGGDIFSWSGYIVGGIPTGVVLQHWGESTTSFGKMIDDTSYNVLVGSKGMKVDGPVTIPTRTKIRGDGVGISNYSYLQFMEQDDSTRAGWIGFASSTNDYLSIQNEMGSRITMNQDLYINNNLAWHDGNVVYGSNSNGRYIQFPNGVQICWGSISVSLNPSTAWGNFFRTAYVSFTFPSSFTGTPAGTFSYSALGSTIAWAIMRDFSATSGAFALARTTNSLLEGELHFTAIGRWK